MASFALKESDGTVRVARWSVFHPQTAVANVAHLVNETPYVFLVWCFLSLACSTLAVGQDKAGDVGKMNEYELNQYFSDLDEQAKEAKASQKALASIQRSLQDARERLARPADALRSAQDGLDAALKSRDPQRIPSAIAALMAPFDGLMSVSYIYIGVPAASEDPGAADLFRKFKNRVEELNGSERVVSSLMKYRELAYGNKLGGGGSRTPTQEEINDIRQTFTPQALESLRQKLLAIVDASNKDAEEVKAKTEDQLKNISQQRSLIQRRREELGKEKQDINQRAISLGLPAFCITVVILFAIPTAIFFSKHGSTADGSADVVSSIFKSGILVEINTVLLLTMTILILGLANKIEGPVLGTLLGGISGYVLNRFRQKTETSEAAEKPEGPQAPASPPDQADKAAAAATGKAA